MKKICSICKQQKEIDFFPKRGKGTRKHCKLCANNMVKKHYQNNKQYYFDKNKKQKNNIKIEYVIFMKDKCCVDCGEKDPIVLEFDHIDPKLKGNNISAMLNSGGYCWNSILKEISKCEIRCANCHKRRTAKQFNWYKARNLE